MSIYIVRACRALAGKRERVKDVLSAAVAGTPGTYLYQSLGDPNDFGIFAEFPDEASARKFAATHTSYEGELAPLIEGATGVTAWKRV
jgi:hypothetical protein